MEITKESIEGALQKKGVRAAIKTLLVLFATALSVLFFGICVPFFLLGFGILPSLGVAGVVYLIAGAAFGLLFAGISSGVSLARSPRLLTPYYLVLVAALAIATLSFYVLYMSMAEKFAHI
jgi:hypothetical protein